MNFILNFSNKANKYRCYSLAVFIGSLAFLAPTPLRAQSNSWLSQDIGSIGVAGSSTYNASSGGFAVGGSGADIWGTGDAFHFVCQPLNGDGQITVRVAAVSNTNGWAKAGVMIRESLSANSSYADVMVTPSSGVVFQKRSGTGASAGTVALLSGQSAPYWVRLRRLGNNFTAFSSPDGQAWTQLGTQSLTLNASVYIGLMVCSHNNSRLCTATFDNLASTSEPVTIPPTAPTLISYSARSDTEIDLTWSGATDDTGIHHYNLFRNGTAIGGNLTAASYPDIQLSPATTYQYTVQTFDFAGNSSPPSSVFALSTDANWLPAPWQHQDLGSVMLGGASQYDSATGRFIIQGAGADIWGTSDAFQYAWQTLSGDGQVIARVLSVQNTNAWAKAGIMLRRSLDPGSAYIMLMLTPGNGTDLQWRSTGAGNAATLSAGAASSANWFRLVRQGNTITASRSLDGVSWSPVGQQTLTWTGNIYAGLAVCSHTTSAVATAVMDNVNILSSLPVDTQAPTLPTGLTTGVVTDVGITLTWQASADQVKVSGYKIYRNGSYVGSSSSTRFVDTGLAPNTAYNYSVSAFNPAGMESAPGVALTVTTAASTVSVPWQHSDIGAVGLLGNVTNSGNGSFQMSASGADIWNTVDAFHYLWQPFAGDVTLITKVDSVQGINAWSKAGLMLRESSDPAAQNVLLAVTPGNGVTFQWRSSTAAGSSYTHITGLSAPLWLKLSELAGVCSGYYSTDGTTWTQVGSRTMTLSGSALEAGLAVTSHDNGKLCSAAFEQTSVSIDSDGNGLPDWWELQYFGKIGNNASSSPNGNGLTLLQDYQQGNDPTNYYSQNGTLITPVLSIVSGNNQTAKPGAFAASPLVVQITNAANSPLVNAPLTFSISSGAGGLALVNTGNSSNATVQSVSDASGQVSVYFQGGASAGNSTVSASAGSGSAQGQVSFSETTASAFVDTDGNGLPDWWELYYFGQIGNVPNALAARGDGLTLLQAYQQGLDPNDPNGVVPQLTLVSGDQQFGPPGTLAANPLVVQVTDASNGNPLPNVPVTFSAGDALLASSNNATALPAVTALTVFTDANGLASNPNAPVYVELQSSPGSSEVVWASVDGAAAVSFTLYNYDPSQTLAAPTAMYVLPGAGGNLLFYWQQASPQAAGFVLQQSLDNGVTWQDLAYIPTGYNQWSMAAAAGAQYRMQATDATGRSAATGAVQVITAQGDADGDHIMDGMDPNPGAANAGDPPPVITLFAPENAVPLP